MLENKILNTNSKYQGKTEKQKQEKQDRFATCRTTPFGLENTR